MTDKLKDRISTDRFFMTDIFFCLFLALSGTGHFFNELFQIAGVVSPADIGLGLFVGVWLLCRNVKIERKHYYLIVCFVYVLAMALIDRHGIGHILRDIKVFMYFFVPYFYIWQRKDDYKFVKMIIKTTFAMLIFTCVAFVVNFFTVGLYYLRKNGYLGRTNGLGLMEYIFPIVLVLFLGMGDKLKEKFGKILYWFMMAAFLVLMIVGWTRSAWLILPMAFVMYYFLNYINGEYKEIPTKVLVKRIVIFVLAMIVLVFAAYFVLKLTFPSLAQAIVERFITFTELGQNTKYDTLTMRIDDVLKYESKYKNPRVIIGWGFGDMLPGEPSTIIENSFWYYVWKYGVVWSCVLGYKIIQKLWIMFKRKNKTNNAMIAVVIAYFLMGGVSGHFNKYYIEPFIAMVLIIDMHRYLYATSQEDY